MNARRLAVYDAIPVSGSGRKSAVRLGFETHPGSMPASLIIFADLASGNGSSTHLARVGLVNPLRDGMNLVAKEYVAAQDPDDPGVLILSRFVGAAVDGKRALESPLHSVGWEASDLFWRSNTWQRLWREIEVEVPTADPALQRAAADVLLAAGARPAGHGSKLARVLDS